MKKEILMLPVEGDILCHYHLSGDKGGVDFSFVINMNEDGMNGKTLQSAFVGTHHNEEVKGYAKQSGICACTGNDGCWYDGSGLLGDMLLDVFKVEGSDAVWQSLENKYKSEFSID